MKYISTLLLSIFSFLALAQQTQSISFRELKGHVTTADDQPAGNYHIGIYGTDKRALTNKDGNFTIIVPNIPVLIGISDGKKAFFVPVSAQDQSLSIKFDNSLTTASGKSYAEWRMNEPGNSQHLKQLYQSPYYLMFLGRNDPDGIGSPNAEIPLNNATAKPVQDPNAIYTNIETIAQYKGGVNDWNQYVKENLKYPEKAKTNGTTGRVILSFVVEKDGSLTGIKALRSLSPECDEEAIRLVKASGKWKPATANQGMIVRSQYTLPVSFGIN